jgi:hypothetical protein
MLMPSAFVCDEIAVAHGSFKTPNLRRLDKDLSFRVMQLEVRRRTYKASPHREDSTCFQADFIRTEVQLAVR